MKRLFSFTLALLLIAMTALALENVPVRRLVPMERYALADGDKGSWASDYPGIVFVDEKGSVTALAAGEALLTRTVKNKMAAQVRILVEEQPEAPESIWQAIAAAIAEWEAAGGEPFKKSNKYTTWYYGPKASFGWCGAFAAYALEAGGVSLAPTDTYRKLEPLNDGSPYGVREAGVPKLLTGYENLDRMTNIPRPGYLAVYGKRGGYAALHVGLITRVQNLGDGLYLLETAEGNLASRVKRLSYVYDSTAGEKGRNIRMANEELQTQPDVFQYKLTDEDWRVTAFLQTWY